MASSRLPLWARVIVGLVLSVVALSLPYLNPPETNQMFSEIMYIAIAAMGLNLLTGFNGQISIGHGAFFGVGAFTSAILVVDHGWQLEATLPVAALLAAVLGVFVGFPALRVKGLYLALITLGLSVLFPSVVQKFVKGPGGVSLLQPSIKQVSSLVDGMPDDIYRYYLCLIVLIITFAMAASVVFSRVGRAMIAVRDQEVAASTVGVNVSGVKVASFALSAAYAGVAGSLSVMIDRVADATNPLIYFQRSIEFLIAMVIGGSATIAGPLLGAALLVAIRKRTEGTEALAPALLGGALILAVFLLPEGLVGGWRRFVAWAAGRFGGGDASSSHDDTGGSLGAATTVPTPSQEASP